MQEEACEDLLLSRYPFCHQALPTLVTPVAAPLSLPGWLRPLGFPTAGRRGRGGHAPAAAALLLAASPAGSPSPPLKLLL